MKPGSTFLGRLSAQIAGIGEIARGWNAGRELDDRIHRVDEELRTLRREMDVLKAQALTTRERRDALADKLLQRETQAMDALRTGHPALAREVAAAIVDLEAEHRAEQALLAANAKQAAGLQAMVRQGENTLRRLKHELDLLRASEAVASAEQAFAGSQAGEGAGIPTAIDSAELLRARQAAAQSDAAPATGSAGPDPLDEKLRKAGIAQPASPVDAVLARLAEQAGVTVRPPGRSGKRSGTAANKENPDE